MNNPIYIVEHLEPELYEWCIIEYAHISKQVGKDNLWFTNLNEKQAEQLKEYGSVFTHSVSTMALQGACILDPAAPHLLIPSDGKKFNYYIFGGILGDYPPKQRTGPELTARMQHTALRHIGEKQLSTDNAVYVVQQIVNGTPLEKIEFQDGAQVEIEKNLSIELPYRYPIINGKPRMSPKLLTYLKNKKDF